MKALEVVSKAVKAVAAAVTGSVERPRSRHAVEEMERRAEINARGAAIRAGLAGGGRGWLGNRGPGWLSKRGR